jgi:hypothetical protein
VCLPPNSSSHISRADPRHEATPEMWTETYLSAILRAIRYADDASYRLAGYRKLDPITTIEGESRFLKAAEELFFQGMSPFYLYCGISTTAGITWKEERRGRDDADDRLATRFRPRDSGRYERHEPLDCRYSQVLCRFIPSWTSCQLV